MSVIAVILQEGFGNRLGQYAFARAYAEKHGCQLQTNRWMGQKIFQIDDPPIERELPQYGMEELEYWDGATDIQIAGWGQHQKNLIYSRADARRYFTFRPEILELLKAVPHLEIAAHLRWADFLAFPEANFIAISAESYRVACDKFGLDRNKITFLAEESPLVVPGIDPGQWLFPHSDHHTRGTDERVTNMGFLPDFYAMMTADVLFRANSTFSLWAGILGNHKRIFSPDVRGIGKLKEAQFVPFVEGNHMPISDGYGGHSELHLRET